MISARVWRVVESQVQVATNALVDDLSEQLVLEELLDISKPNYPDATDRLHYLLKTPFRYPPLRWGSRFGDRLQRGIFYAAHAYPTALSEAAFYRLLFWRGMQTPPTLLRSQHLVFAARCHTENGFQLQHPPFTRYSKYLCDPVSYAVTQTLGLALREKGIEVIEYRSARDAEQGKDVAVFSPAGLRSRQPEKKLNALAQTSADGVVFKVEQTLYEFPLEQFLVDGQFPLPG